MNKLKLQKKRQIKEAKRNLKRKAIRKYRNNLLSLGVRKRQEALFNAKRTAIINEATKNMDAIIKRWNDKISLDLLAKIETQKITLNAAMKLKDATLIKRAIDDFVPLNKELLEIVEKLEYPEKISA